jgi:peptidylprolyl isomerase
MTNTGKTATVHYKGYLKDGEVFDTSEGRDPLSFEVGSGQMIKGFDTAVQTMEPGQTKTVNIPSEEAYGPIREDLVITFPSEKIPKEIEPKEGMMLQLQSQQGNIPACVTNVSDDSVTVDANHPLAGKDLNFDITLVELA